MSEQDFQNQQMISAKSKGATAVLCFSFCVLGIFMLVKLVRGLKIKMAR